MEKNFLKQFQCDVDEDKCRQYSGTNRSGIVPLQLLRHWQEASALFDL
jgi:hypothetical protein